ncbi:Gti1/Pac2 family-domain-containing protein [Mycotypha africana]|uniref:Gti1/Pac2 family-domain-containing protein n=1 Tax=Mycotypha africana TaxID=64632 RepID=UPI002301D64C|nr:Gti1/Pac2 family-domain-containing protein [Mycotypha africana]KAI8984295.1 Gti1/Pac2 family-domain-containing protein [Mycotypha africana]
MPFSKTFHGFIESTNDILVIIEGCRAGKLPMVNRRLIQKERHAIKSGTIIVFDETETGIKRWTDGFLWSPSRILGNFLIYRELESREARKIDNDYQHCFDTQQEQQQQQQQQPYLPNNEDAELTTTNKEHRATFLDRNANSSVLLAETLSSLSSPMKYSTAGSGCGPESSDGSNKNSSSSSSDAGLVEIQQRERALVGSLTTANTSYNFKKNGLIKKTIRLMVNGNQLHVVNYYSKDDALHNLLPLPSNDPQLSQLRISSDLLIYLNKDLNLYNQRDKSQIDHSKSLGITRKHDNLAEEEDLETLHRIRVSKDTKDEDENHSTAAYGKTATENDGRLQQKAVKRTKVLTPNNTPYPYPIPYTANNALAAGQHQLLPPSMNLDQQQAFYQYSTVNPNNTTYNTASGIVLDPSYHYKTPFTELPPLFRNGHVTTKSHVSVATQNKPVLQAHPQQNALDKLTDATPIYDDDWSRGYTKLVLHKSDPPLSRSPSPLSSRSTMIPAISKDFSGHNSNSSYSNTSSEPMEGGDNLLENEYEAQQQQHPHYSYPSLCYPWSYRYQ